VFRISKAPSVLEEDLKATSRKKDEPSRIPVIHKKMDKLGTLASNTEVMEMF